MKLNNKTIFCFFLSVIFTATCLGSQSKPRKSLNLIIIAMNNVGAEHVSLYGYERKTTPNLERWAKDALVFENVYTPASWTLPVMTSVFTSLNPYTHKVMDRYYENTLSSDIKVLPQILKENGYATAAFTGGLDNSRFFGHMQGFSAVSDNRPFTGFCITLKQAGEWLSKNSEKKFFLFIHGYDAHPPFTPPSGFRGIFSNPKGKKITINPEFTYRGFRNSDGQYYAQCFIPDPRINLFSLKEKGHTGKWIINPSVKLTQDDIDYLRDLYDEEVLSVDSQVTRFLDSLPAEIVNNTLIIVFSEHGEMFAKHGRFGRAGTLRGTLYDDVVHVPFIMKIPGQKGGRIKGLVGLIDMMPTIMDIIDIPMPYKIQGKSILPLVKENRQINDFIYSGATYNFAKAALQQFYMPPSINESIRDFNWKLIHEIIYSKDKSQGKKISEETFELYDLKNDPDELQNVIDRYPEKAKELRSKLNRWAEECRRFKTSGVSTYEIPEKMLEDARRNGYW